RRRERSRTGRPSHSSSLSMSRGPIETAATVSTILLCFLSLFTNQQNCRNWRPQFLQFPPCLSGRLIYHSNKERARARSDHFYVEPERRNPCAFKYETSTRSSPMPTTPASTIMQSTSWPPPSASSASGNR